MKKYLPEVTCGLVLVTTMLMSACKAVIPSTLAVATQQIASTDSSIPYALITPTLPVTPHAIITRTSTLTVLPTHSRQVPSSTPTATRAVAPVVTGAAICPEPASDVKLDVSDPFNMEALLLEFLNAGGTVNTLQKFATAQSADVTGDGVPEIVVSLDQGYVFRCVSKFYEALLVRQADDPNHPPVLEAVMDLNADGMPEIVFSEQMWGAHNYMLSAEILEWDGTAFHNLPLCYREPECQEGNFDTVVGAPDGWLEFRDLDHDGTIAVIVNEIPLIDCSTAPDDLYCSTVLALVWDGNKFIGHRIARK